MQHTNDSLTYFLWSIEPVSWVHNVIYERGAIAAALEEFQVDGEIYYIVHGMDCDCVQYTTSATKMPATIQAWEAMQRKIHEHAEGPIGASIVPIEDVPYFAKGFERDLIMEAHENGHPHTVCTVNY